MKNSPPSRSVLRFLAWSAAVFVVLALGAGVAAYVIYQRYETRAAAFDLTKIDDVAERSAVYDANGEFYSHFGGENRFVVPLSAVSPQFLSALLAREDARFWEHRGVDTRGVLRALIANLRAGGKKQGASTLTQQLARNACELRAKTLDRKMLEAVLARRIEATYTKEQILELYVNRIFFGTGCYGIEAASREYLGKPARDLSLGEGAMLAGLIRSPNRLAPSHDLAAALAGRDAVLDRMVELRSITPEQAAVAKAQQIRVADRPAARVAQDEVMDATLRELSLLLAPETIDYGGLTVFTTIDPQLQRRAQEAADRKLAVVEEQKNYPHPKRKDFAPEQKAEGEEKPTDYLQAAVVVVENRTGAIRAMVGGRDYTQSKYLRASLAKRQLGSTFKPFVYASAFERGLLPGTLIDDSRVTSAEYPDLPKNWSPDNSDDEYNGPQPAAIGLLKSRNTMSVRVGEYAGLPKVREFARTVGLAPELPNYPVVFLGGFETTVRDLAAAYAIFPNLGTYRQPYLISSVEDRHGQVLWKAPQQEQRVLSPESAWMVSSILQQVMKTGTAAKAGSLGWKKPGAGKTGTTNDFFDAWFVGYTGSLTCAVWVGMDQPQTIMEKGYGGALALPIWVDIMQNVPEQKWPAAPFVAPERPAKAILCSVSGGLATSACQAQKLAYTAELPAARVPHESCPTHPEPPLTAPVVTPVVTAIPPPAPAPVAPPAASALTQPTYPQPFADVVPPAPAPNRTVQLPVARYGQTIPAPPTQPARVEPRPVSTPLEPGATAADPRRSISTAPLEQVFTPIIPTTPAPRPASPRAVEVRRAIPVVSGAAAPAPVGEVTTTRNGGVTEQRIVERTPDGITRTTIIRSRGASAPAKKNRGDRDRDDD